MCVDGKFAVDTVDVSTLGETFCGNVLDFSFNGDSSNDFSGKHKIFDRLRDFSILIGVDVFDGDFCSPSWSWHWFSSFDGSFVSSSSSSSSSKLMLPLITMPYRFTLFCWQISMAEFDFIDRSMRTRSLRCDSVDIDADKLRFISHLASKSFACLKCTEFSWFHSKFVRDTLSNDRFICLVCDLVTLSFRVFSLLLSLCDVTSPHATNGT